jgi:hypothetical protein
MGKDPSQQNVVYAAVDGCTRLRLAESVVPD